MLPAATEPHFVQEPDKSGWPAPQREQEANSRRDDKEDTEQIYCRTLFETFLITSTEVRGDDMTPFCKVEVSS